MDRQVGSDLLNFEQFGKFLTNSILYEIGMTRQENNKVNLKCVNLNDVGNLSWPLYTFIHIFVRTLFALAVSTMKGQKWLGRLILAILKIGPSLFLRCLVLQRKWTQTCELMDTNSLLG